MYENSEENIGWLRYLFDFIEKDFCTMDTLTDESHGDKLIGEFKLGNCNLPGKFLQTSPEEQKNLMFDQQPTSKQSSSEKPPTNCSNEENSSMCGQIIKSEKMTTSKQGLQVLLIAPLLALAATQNKHNPLFLNNQEEYDMVLGKQGSVEDHTNLQTDKETINKMMFLKHPDEGILKGSVSLKQQTNEKEEVSNHFERWSMLPSDDTDKETIKEMMFFPDLDYLYEGTVPWEYTQDLGPQVIPDQESLDEENQSLTPQGELQLEIRLKEDETTGNLERRGPVQKIYRVRGHNFKKVHFPAPTYCSRCSEFIWGVGKQGMKCYGCSMAVHKRCHKLVLAQCKAPCTHIPWEYTQDLGPQIIPDQESLDEENQVFTHVPWEYTQDLVQFLSFGSIDSEASSKKYNFKAYHHDRHQCDLVQKDEYDLHLVQREDEDHIIQHPSLNFGQLDDQKTGKQLSKNDENFGKLYQKFSHLVTQMTMEDRKEVDLEMNCLSIDSNQVVLLL